MRDVINVRGLTKVYSSGNDFPPFTAVNEIDFSVKPGEVFGFLGPNGAGKTTTIRMLTGLSRPTSGRASVLGLNLDTQLSRIKKRIGVVPEISNLYDELTAFENLVFSMQLYGVPRVEWRSRAESLLERFHLSEKRDTPFAKLSRGMKRALTIAAALVHNPPLIFLDEPTTGLDVMSARRLRQMVTMLREEGVTIFLTTHYLEEADRLCDRVAVIVKGQIVALDRVEKLKAAAQDRTVVEITVEDSQGAQEKHRLEVNDGVQAAVERLLAGLNGRRLLAINTLRPSLEDVFVKLTGLNAEIMLIEKGGKGGSGNG